MFNGIIYNQGSISKIVKRDKGLNIFVKSNLKVSSRDMGLSVACDGVCLTLISFKKKNMEFYLSNETIKRSKFKFLKPRDIINLELPLKYGTKISGHICQGHVDTVGKVLRISKVDKSSTNLKQSSSGIQSVLLFVWERYSQFPREAPIAPPPGNFLGLDSLSCHFTLICLSSK